MSLKIEAPRTPNTSSATTPPILLSDVLEGEPTISMTEDSSVDEISSLINEVKMADLENASKAHVKLMLFRMLSHFIDSFFCCYR